LGSKQSTFLLNYYWSIFEACGVPKAAIDIDKDVVYGLENRRELVTLFPIEYFKCGEQLCGMVGQDPNLTNLGQESKNVLCAASELRIFAVG
jgi:hypothetical protein